MLYTTRLSSYLLFGCLCIGLMSTFAYADHHKTAGDLCHEQVSDSDLQQGDGDFTGFCGDGIVQQPNANGTFEPCDPGPFGSATCSETCQPICEGLDCSNLCDILEGDMFVVNSESIFLEAHIGLQGSWERNDYQQAYEFVTGPGLLDKLPVGATLISSETHVYDSAGNNRDDLLEGPSPRYPGYEHLITQELIGEGFVVTTVTKIAYDGKTYLYEGTWDIDTSAGDIPTVIPLSCTQQSDKQSWGTAEKEMKKSLQP